MSHHIKEGDNNFFKFVEYVAINLGTHQHSNRINLKTQYYKLLLVANFKSNSRFHIFLKLYLMRKKNTFIIKSKFKLNYKSKNNIYIYCMYIILNLLYFKN